MNYAAVIREARKRAGLSQVALAALSQVSLPTIQNIERGRGNPSIATLIAIGDELGLEIQLNPKLPDWAFLAKAGVPLSVNGESFVELTQLNLLSEFKTLMKAPLESRELQAVAATVLALIHHFPSTAVMVPPQLVKRVSSAFEKPEVLKLKRIANARLASWL